MPWAVLRGADALDRPLGDVDLLVGRGHGDEADRALAAAGYLRLRVWAHGGQRFHVAYDEASGTWVHLHVVDRLAFGEHAGLELGSAGDAVLGRRRRHGDVWALDPDDELWVTLLHVVLDKGGVVKPAHRTRVADLAVHDRVLESPVCRAWADEGGGQPAALLALARTGGWDQAPAEAGRVRAAWRAADPEALDRARSNRRTLLGRKVQESVSMRGLSVALLAPDGAGKSTVTRRVAEGFFLDARVLYLGLYGAADRVVDLPIPGSGLVQRLVRTWARWLVAQLHQRRRRLVLFDRHPYDARLDRPGPAVSVAGRARRAVLGRSLPPPDVVIVLDAPGQVLFDRKGEHDPEHLEVQRRAYRQLAVRLGRRAEVVDATVDEDAVVRAVTAAIWRRYLARQAGRR